MLINWVQISLIILGIFLLTGFFLRLSYLHHKATKNLDFLQRILEEGVVKLSHKTDLVDRQIQDMRLDIKDLNMRTNIVETRLEERNAALFLSATVAPPSVTGKTPKRGRPRKNVEE